MDMGSPTARALKVDKGSDEQSSLSRSKILSLVSVIILSFFLPLSYCFGYFFSVPSVISLSAFNGLSKMTLLFSFFLFYFEGGSLCFYIPA